MCNFCSSGKRVRDERTDRRRTHLGSEVARVTWGSEGDQKIVQDIERSSEDNIFHGELKIEEGMQPGKWKIDHILFPDSYSYAKVTSLMQEWDGIKVLGQGETLTSVVDDLSFSEFTVQGTKADGKAPVVRKKSIALTGKAVKKKGKAKAIPRMMILREGFFFRGLVG